MKQDVKRPGRPRSKPVAAGDRVPLSLRVTPQLKARLETVAKESGRSQSQEAEIRLELLFRDQGLLGKAMRLSYGPKLAGLLLLLNRVFADTIMRAEWAGAEGDWFSDPWVYDQAAQSIEQLLSVFRPEGEVSPPISATDPSSAPVYGRIGRGSAEYLLAQLIHKVAADRPGELDEAKLLLGDLVERVRPEHLPPSVRHKL